MSPGQKLKSNSYDYGCEASYQVPFTRGLDSAAHLLAVKTMRKDSCQRAQSPNVAANTVAAKYLNMMLSVMQEGAHPQSALGRFENAATSSLPL